jgi:porin
VNKTKPQSSRVIPSLLLIVVLCASQHPGNAQDKTVVDANGTEPPASSPAPAGLLPIPDYSADFWTRSFLTGDWGGMRTDLANKGIQIGIEWNQFVQGIASGGRDQTTEYDATWDYTINLDLMRMGLLPGALIKFRAESRYGDSVNGIAGPILPVNTRGFFPLTSKLDADVGITITDLNYTQFLSPHFAVFFGKLDTLDGDHNEFASGRGTSQFMNANFIFNPALALRLPYSTLGAGVLWLPIPPGPKGGVTVSSTVVNTNDSSTKTGFEDFDKGQSWTTEADFTYKLADLPGGMNVGGLYSFNQDFARLNSRLIFQPGEGLVVPKQKSTWAVYWSGWQYLFVDDPGGKPPAPLQGQPEHRGIGLFARFGVADKETNPVEWAGSGGIGGRGLIPSRDNDSFGIGYYYNRIQTLRLSNILGIRDSSQGFEFFYNFAVTPAARVTFDVQVVESASARVDTATILGARGTLDF